MDHYQVSRAKTSEERLIVRIACHRQLFYFSIPFWSCEHSLTPSTVDRRSWKTTLVHLGYQRTKAQCEILTQRAKRFFVSLRFHGKQWISWLLQLAKGSPTDSHQLDTSHRASPMVAGKSFRLRLVETKMPVISLRAGRCLFSLCCVNMDHWCHPPKKIY